MGDRDCGGGCLEDFFRRQQRRCRKKAAAVVKRVHDLRLEAVMRADDAPARTYMDTFGVVGLPVASSRRLDQLDGEEEQ